MTTQQPEALAFCWATELAMTQQPVTLSVTEAREVSAEMQRLHAENTALQQGYAAARLEIESLKAQLADHADELVVAHLDGRMRAAQHAGVMLGEQAELRRLSDCCPELNLSNYGPDDVDELNGWAIEVSQCIDRALAAQPAGAQEPVAWRVHPFDYGVGSEGVYAMTALTQQRDVWERRGWKTEPLYTASQPSPTAQGDALDAERLDWLLLHISGAEFRRIGVHYSGNARRADVDAARKQGANHD